MPARLPRFVRVWFALDLGLALLPPVHWSLGGPGRILGMPMGLVYLGLTCLCVASSVVVAYLADPRRTDEP